MLAGTNHCMIVLQRLAPLLQVMGEESGGASAAPYYPPLASGADAYGVSSSSTSTVYMPPGHHNAHLMDTTTDLQLVLASNGKHSPKLPIV